MIKVSERLIPAFASAILFVSSVGVAADFDPYETSVMEIHEAMAAGDVTARQLVEYYLARIEAYDKQGPAINSIITINPNALERADELDRAYRRNGLTGPLARHSDDRQGQLRYGGHADFWRFAGVERFRTAR